MLILQKLVDNLELLRPDLTATLEDVHILQSQVSKDKNVQKISLVCFCKQELGSLVSRSEGLLDEVTRLIDECDRAIDQKRSLDQEVAKIEKYFAKHKWTQRKVPTTSSPEFDLETIDRLHRSMTQLKTSQMITADFFRRNLRVLEHAEKFLRDDQDEEEGVKGRGAGPGLLLSCMPVMIVTSALMVYNYCSPVSLLQKFCRLYNVQENN